MIDTPAANLLNHASGLTKMRDDMKARYQSAVNIGFGPVEYLDADREMFRLMASVLRPWLASHEMVGSLDRLDMAVDYAADADCHIDDLADQLTILLEIMEAELSRRLFLSLPAADMAFYQHPERVFPATMKAFPSAIEDIKEACRCYALEAHSACVFHSMGIIQRGLYALAKDIKVEFAFPLHLAEWQAIIDRIEGRIATLRSLPRGVEKDETLSYYSECAVQFRYFKDAWRNHICHMRDTYSRVQARTILTHTQAFMEELSKRLQEIPIPPIVV